MIIVSLHFMWIRYLSPIPHFNNSFIFNNKIAKLIIQQCTNTL